MRHYLIKSIVNTSTFPAQLRELVYSPETGRNLYDYIINNNNPPLTLSQKKVAYDKLSAFFKEHKIESTSKLQCPCNGISTMNKQAIFDHINAAHVQYEQFSCSKCSAIFFSKLTLNRHDRGSHTGKGVLQDSQQGNVQLAKKPNLESAPLKNPPIAFPLSQEDLIAATILQQLSTH
jgi:hypothetical protein